MKSENSLMIFDDLVDFLRDPETGLLFRDPIVTPEGVIRERSYYMKENSIEQNDSLKTVQSICNLVDKVINMKPELEDEKYSEKKPYNLYKKEIIEIINNKEYVKLEDYYDFRLNDCPELLKAVVRDLHINIFKYVVNNSVDYDEVNPETGNSLIHSVCEFDSSDSVLKCLHLLTKKVNLNIKNKAGFYPLDIVLLKQEFKYKIVTNMINNNVKLKYEDSIYQPIHLLMFDYDDEVMNMFIREEIDINTPIINNMLPIHILLSFGSYSKILNGLTNSSAKWDLKSKNNDKNCIEMIFENKLLSEEEKYKLIKELCDTVIKMS